MGSAELTARAGYATLTGILGGIAKVNPQEKVFILKALIQCHTDNPLYHSKEWVEEWKKELAI